CDRTVLFTMLNTVATVPPPRPSVVTAPGFGVLEITSATKFVSHGPRPARSVSLKYPSSPLNRFSKTQGLLNTKSRSLNVSMTRGAAVIATYRAGSLPERLWCWYQAFG